MNQVSEKIAEITFQLRGLARRIEPVIRVTDAAELANVITQLAALVTPPEAARSLQGNADSEQAA